MPGPPRPPHPGPRERYRFGLYELDVDAAELRRDGRRVPLQDLPLRLLETLVRRPGELVSRDELRATLWPPDVHVDFDGSLNAAVRRLREALGDSAKDPRFLETVPRRGYRFIAPAAAAPAPTAASSSPASGAAGGASGDTAGDSSPGTRTRRRRLAWLPAAAVMGALVAFALRPGAPGEGRGDPASDSGRAASSVDAPQRIAVLPLDAIGDDVRLGPIAAGLTDELIVHLAGVEPERLHLVAPASVRRAHAEDASIQSIAGRLDAGFVLAGGLQLEDSRLRVAARLVRAEDETVMWSTALDRQLGSLLDVQRDLAARLGNALRRELLDEIDGDGAPAAADAVSPEAYEHFLRARHFLAQQTPAGLASAGVELRRALDIEPGFANAWAYLAFTRAQIGIYDLERPRDVFPRAERAVERALALDPENADALVARAMIDGAYHWQADDAVASLHRVLDRSPHHVEALRLLGLWLQARGRDPEAQAIFDTARRLDPLSLTLQSTVGWGHYLAGRTERAVEQARAVLDLDADYLVAWDDLKWFYITLGRGPEAADAFMRVVELEGDPGAVPGLRTLYGERGLRGLLEASVESHLAKAAGDGYHSPYDVAIALAAVGRGDEALDWLERSFEEREVDMLALATDPRLEAVRGEPRYRALLERFRGAARATP